MADLGNSLGLVWVRYLIRGTQAKLIEKIPKRAGAIITTFLIGFRWHFNGFMSVTVTGKMDNQRSIRICLRQTV